MSDEVEEVILKYLDKHWTGLSGRATGNLMEDMVRKYNQNLGDGKDSDEAVRLATMYFRVCKPYLGKLETRERRRSGGF